MSLRLIYGRAGSGKSCFCYNDIKRNIKNIDEKPLILIVPEQFSFQAQKDFLNIVGESGAFNAEVLDFKRMAFKALNELGGITKNHMDESGKGMLINYILEKSKEEFNTFNMAAKQKGFVKVISSLISEFKRFKVTPQILKDTISKNVLNPGLKEKIEDISLVYENFDNILHENYIDSDDDLNLLADKIENWDYIKGSEIWIDEFSSFTPQQYKIIEALLKKGKRINITLCLDFLSKENLNEIDVFSVTAYTEKKLLKVAENNNISIDKSLILDSRPFFRYKDSSEIGFLEKELYAFPNNVYKEKTNDIRLLRASNDYFEAENTARDIVRLCREEKIRFKDIAVVAKNLKKYEKILSVIFDEYEIPYFIDEKKSIDSNLLVILINSAIEIVNKNWSYESIFRYLKTGLTSIERDDIDLLENYILATGIRGRKKWEEDKDWAGRMKSPYDDYILTQSEEESIIKINLIKNSVAKPILKLHKSISGKNKVKDKCTAIFQFLADLGVPDKVEQWINSFNAQHNPKLANEYSQIWNTIMEILDQIVQVLGEKVLSLDEFIKVLSIGFDEHKMGLIPPSMDQVLIGSVDRIKSHDVKVLYIIGVNDGVFPSPSLEEGILTDEDRTILNNLGIELAKDTKTQAFEEQFLIYTTLTLSSRYLRLSYPIADFEGKALRPSIIISRIRTLYPNITEENDIIENESDQQTLNLISSKIPTFNSLITQVRKYNDGESKNLLWEDVFKWYYRNDEWKQKVKSIFSALSYTNQVSLVKTNKIKKLYGDDINYSVSRFEKYIQCPFEYYVQYGLNAKERKIQKFSAPDLGSFMHQVIDKFSMTVQEGTIKWRDIDEKYCSETIINVIDEIIKNSNDNILSSTPRYDFYTRRLKRILTRAMLVIIEQIKRSGFEPVAFEKEFRKGSSYPPIIIELANGEKINVIGKIDRIDMLEKSGETYIRIIDYKSGSKEFKLSDVYSGLQVQLLLYLDAVLTDEGKYMNKSMLPGGMLYFKIDDPIIKYKREMTDEDIENEIVKALKMKGLVLNDVNIVKEMDNKIEGNSIIIPARLNANGELGKSSAASAEQFILLRKHVRKCLKECCERMLDGNIEIKPFKKGKDIACRFCSYASVCQFDKSLENNSYNLINDIDDDTVWKYLEKEGK